MNRKEEALYRDSLYFVTSRPDATAEQVPARLLRFWLRLPYEHLDMAFYVCTNPQTAVFHALLMAYHMRRGCEVEYIAQEEFRERKASGEYRVREWGEGRFERLEPADGKGGVLASEEEFTDLFKTFHTFVRDAYRARRPFSHPCRFLRRKRLRGLKLFALHEYPRHYPLVAFTRND